MSDDELESILDRLGSTRSAERRSAAKQLRRERRVGACDTLLGALRRELSRPRTWETQYQMIMAIGACDCIRAFDYLKEVAAQDDRASTVLTAIGHTIVDLGRALGDADSALLWCLHRASPDVFEGGVRAVAVNRIPIREETQERVVAAAVAAGSLFPARYWVAAAAVDWDVPSVGPFLESCTHDDVAEIADVAARSLRGERPRFSIL